MGDFHQVPPAPGAVPPHMKQGAVFAFSRRGMETARRIRAERLFQSCRYFAPARLAEAEFEAVEGALPDFVEPIFRRTDALIFVGACGIAVRAVAPHLRSKAEDPAVLAVDETARFVVPLVSGHIGGANRLARLLARDLEAEPVVTTATDVNAKFSVDAWAAEQGLHINRLDAAKAVSAAILEGPVPLKSDFPIAGELPPGVVPGDRGSVGICVSWKRNPDAFDRTLLLTPRVVRLGIGCRRGTSAAAIEAAVSEVLDAHGIDPWSVKCCASIDLKRDEPGLLDFCRERGWPVEFYSAQELQRVEGAFTPSDFVRSVTGVDNVCERAALLGAEKLIAKKTARDGVTAAAAVERYIVTFS